MERRDHHDWASDAYVEEWVKRQQAADPERARRFQFMCDLFPFPTDTTVTILDVGAGYGPVSKFILDQFANATCIAQDGSEPMLQRARQIMASYGTRFQPHQSDLFDKDWLPQQFGPFDAAVSVSCLHNLRDFKRIREIYSDIRTHLKPGGVFLNLDLVNAPTLALQQHYVRVAAARRQREGASRADVTATLQPAHRSAEQAHQAAEHASAHAFPANLEEQLAALRAVGFTDVDCFWKDLRRALFGGYVS
jgi:tRNA (cmo5U34)-methyltransferase